ncbi:MAG: YtxH domain-containing protein [Gelidibacter sp.]
MADDKNLGDDLDDMLDDAKEGVKKAAHKTEEFAKEFANDTKETFNSVSSDGKNVAIIAHLTLIGWIIALVMNNGNKTEIGSFYIRQMLGIIIIAFLSWIPILGWIAGIFCLILWVMSLISAINGEQKPVFLLGEQFQDWFKSL